MDASTSSASLAGIFNATVMPILSPFDYDDRPGEWTPNDTIKCNQFFNILEALNGGQCCYYVGRESRKGHKAHQETHEENKFH